MPREEKKKRLSEVPEGATLLARFSFALVGPGAAAFAEQAVQSTLHCEVSEVVSICNVAEKPNSEAKQAWEGREEEEEDARPKSSQSLRGGLAPSQLAEAQVAAERAKRLQNLCIYCMLDEDELQIAKVRLKVVENFKDSLHDIQVMDGELKNICFFFLMDPRKDVGSDVLPILNQAFAEMNYMFKSAKRKAPSCKLRGLLLSHAAGLQVGSEDFFLASSAPADVDYDPPDAPGDAEEIAPFVQKLHEVAKAGGSRKPHRKVDFDSGDAIFQALQRVAREMYKANASKRALTQMSSLFDNFTNGAQDNPRRPCCAVQ